MGWSAQGVIRVGYPGYPERKTPAGKGRGTGRGRRHRAAPDTARTGRGRDGAGGAPHPAAGPGAGAPKIDHLARYRKPGLRDPPHSGARRIRFDSIRPTPGFDSIRPDAIESPARPLAGGSPARMRFDSIRPRPRPVSARGRPAGRRLRGLGPRARPGDGAWHCGEGRRGPRPARPGAAGPSRAPPRGPRPAGAACPMRGDPRKTQPHTLGARGRGPHGARRGLRSAQRYLVEPARRAG